MDIIGAKRVAAKLLSYRSYTCKEIIQKLCLKGCEKELAEEVAEEFCRAGILNDEEYAFRYIHDGALIGLKGMHRIKQELAAKGVARSVIERAIDRAEIDTSKQLEDYVSMRYEGKVFKDLRDIEKAKAHLVRRGYGISEINRCFRDLGICVNRGDMD